MSRIVIVPRTERKHKQVQRSRKNVFSKETNIFLLRLLRGKSDIPDTLGNVYAAPHDLQFELAAAIRQQVLPWFWSILLHTVLLIFLALYFFPVVRFEPFDVLSGVANIPIPQELPLNVPFGNIDGNVPNVTENVQDSLPTNKIEDSVPKYEPIHSSPGLNFSGRDINSRTTMLGGGGGSGQTDEAVLAGLRWLMSVQQPNGAWHFSGTFLQSAPVRYEDTLAATAMALLAFQGYGITPDSKHPQLVEFVRPVRRGWEWLLKQQNPDGSFYTPLPGTLPSNHRFYTHGFCTLALCELLAMTGDESLREPAQRSIDYCIWHQSIRCGGWRYLPDRFSEQSDVSVTGWIVLALKSGQAAGLTVPPETYHNVMTFLDSMMVVNQYRYREEESEPLIAMTAEALFCRIMLGWKRTDQRLAAGVKLILETPPSFGQTPPSFEDHYQRDVYYWFFATQTLYHYGGNEWRTWNLIMQEELLQHQEKFGAEVGSWNPDRPARDKWGYLYGRLYTTCMSLYILEVYYRHRRLLTESVL